ncbi:cysteine-rich receptor-like protein kinase 5 [Prosopis cineraria]|uniref:cysteine-rich receptor-like protein kinase 5 n=1 Tax=Prosopis cineraria TaxID=364024 RepID=UPI00241068CB|nr:cysteine-rich receptor-like protein kinase 5 [Prosopis cineraria]
MLPPNLSLPLITFIFWSCWMLNGVVSDPQINLLSQGCTPSNAFFVLSNFSIFSDNVNKTFGEIRKKLVNNQKKHFATAPQGNAENPVFSLFQCRITSPFMTVLPASTPPPNRSGTALPEHKVAVPSTTAASSGSSKKVDIIGGVVGSVACFLVLFVLFAWRIRRPNTPKKFSREEIYGASKLGGLVTYSYRDLKFATNNFSEKNKLGQGGFGVVYKGALKNGKVVAINKLTFQQFTKMEEDFESEVKLISNVHHLNLVRLLGCCNEGQNKLLVYEYMKNNSLDKFLFEIISGQQSKELTVNDAKGEFLLQKAWKLYERGMHLELVDNTLDPNEYDTEEVMKIIEIGLLCTQASTEGRLMMSEVVTLLQYEDFLENMKPTMPILIETN